MMGNVSYPATASELDQVEKACRELGFNTLRREVRRAEDIPKAFENLGGEVDAVYVAVEPLAISRRDEINGRALSVGLPTISGTRDFTAAGGLMAYGPNFPALFARSADLVDKILRGANAGEIPVEQPTKFDFVVNLKTAKTLKLEIPTALLLQADEVIE
jgi:ABC-type uncharacterized transport system substrate-binding protein